MGGGPVMAASLAFPDGYRSAVLVGSTPRFGGEFVKPRNLAIVFGTYEELAELMWKVPRGDEVMRSKPLSDFIGAQGPVQPGKIYGDIAAGDARRLTLVPATHPLEHLSPAAIAAVVDWFQLTLGSVPTPRPTSDQLWEWKEAGTAISGLGALLLVAVLFAFLLKLRWFAAASTNFVGSDAVRGRRWWTSLAAIALVPALVYVPLMVASQGFGPNALFPQLVHNQVLTWAIGGAIASASLLAFFATPDWTASRRLAPSLSAAALAAAGGYLALVLVDRLFLTDFRFWIWGGRTFTFDRLLIAGPYLLLWFFYFALAFRGIGQHLALRSDGRFKSYATFVAAMAGGMACFAVAEYLPMIASHRLLIPDYPLLAILSIHFVPVLVAAGLLGAFVIRRTNDYVPAALLCALIVSWHVTTSTATHWAPGYETPVLPFAAAR